MKLKGIHLADGESNHPNYCLGVKRLYFFDANAADIASCLKLSTRGKLELTNFNRIYLKQDPLNADNTGGGSMGWPEFGRFVATVALFQ